jgi:hypothetical protein
MPFFSSLDLWARCEADDPTMHSAPQLKLTHHQRSIHELFRGHLIWLSANLLASALSRQGFLHSTLRAGLEVEGMALHFLNNVFRLNLAFEPAQGTLDRLTFLQSNFCQIIASKLVPY